MKRRKAHEQDRRQEDGALSAGLAPRVLWARVAIAATIGAGMLAATFFFDRSLLIETLLAGGAEALAFLFFSAVVLLVAAVDTARVASVHTVALELDADGVFDRRVQTCAVRWGDIDRLVWRSDGERALWLEVWPRGEAQSYRRPAPLWGYFGLVAALRRLAARSGFATAPITVDLGSLAVEPKSVLERVRVHWGEPEHAVLERSFGAGR